MSDSNRNQEGSNQGVPESLWKALFEWSVTAREQNDSASPTTSTPEQQQQLSASDREWLEEALAAGVVDLSKQLVDIKAQLETTLPETASEADVAADTDTKVRLLEELLDLVESIDQAKDLSTIGGLGTLLNVIDANEGRPGLQWRAAEVIGTCAQNNPDVQSSFYDAGVMPKIWGLLSSADGTCRLKALLAVSCMLRGSAAVHGWFSENDGTGRMVEMLGDVDDFEDIGDGSDVGDRRSRIRRKCLQILTYVAEQPSVEDRRRLLELSGVLERALAGFLSDMDPVVDRDVEKAALDLGKRLAIQGLLAENPTDLVQALQLYLARMDVVMHDKKEDWEAVEENIVVGKALLEVLTSYVPPAATLAGAPASPSAMQVVAATQTDSNDS